MSAGRLNKKFLRLTSFFTVMFFLHEQIVFSAPLAPEPAYQAEYAIQNPETGGAGTSGSGPVAQSSETFLQDTLVLEPAAAAAVNEDRAEDTAPEIISERRSFDYAIEELSQGIAAAVVLDMLTEKDLVKLLTLPRETGIAVLDGEIVLFSSGGREAIGMLAPAKQLLEKASFIAHTHVEAGSEHGPSSFDLLNAADFGTEYVLTSEGAFEYGREGVENEGRALSLVRFLARLDEALRTPRAETRARKTLNEFISQMDAYNSSGSEDHVVFRKSEQLPDVLNQDFLFMSPLDPGVLGINLQILQETRDAAGKLTSLKTADKLFEYAYDANGRLAALIQKKIVIEEKGLENTALNKPASGSSYSNVNTMPKAAVDGKLSAAAYGWVGNLAGAGDEWLQIDLGKTRNAAKITIDTRYHVNWSSSRRLTHFVVYGSADGVNWTEILREANLAYPAGGIYTKEINPVNLRYVKVSGIHSRDNANAAYDQDFLSEIQIYEKRETLTHFISEKKYNYSFDASGKITEVRSSILTEQAVASRNVSSGKAKSASSTAAGHMIAGASDGKFSEAYGWRGAAVDGTTDWLQLDLGAVKNLHKLRYDTRYHTQYGTSIWQENFSISGSLDGTNWFSLVTQSGLTGASAKIHDFEITPVNARYLKVHGILSRKSSSETWRSAYVTEIQAYETPHTEIPETPEKIYTYDYDAGKVRSIKSAKISDRGKVNLAFKKTVTASSEASTGLAKTRAVDGSYATVYGWEGSAVDGSADWLRVDLGAVKEIGKIRYDARYHVAYGTTIWQEAFTLSGSVDGQNWFPVVQQSGLGRDSAKIHEFAVDAKNIRYLKVHGIKSKNLASVSWHKAFISEIEVFETLPLLPPSAAFLSPPGFKDPQNLLYFLVDGTVRTRALPPVLKTGQNTAAYKFANSSGNETFYFSRLNYTPESPRTVTLQNQTRLFYENGRVVKEITSAGITSTLEKNKGITSYKNADGSGLSFGSGPSFDITLYGPGNLLKETVAKPVPAALDESAAVKLTLENGIFAFYIGGIPAEFRTASGIRITNFTFTEDGSIENALLVYPDKTIEVIRSGKLLRRILADGSIQDFTPAGMLVREINRINVLYYEYEKNAASQVIQTRVYTGLLGRIIYNQVGILLEAMEPGGKAINYTVRVEGNIQIASLNPALSSPAEARTLIEMRYTAAGVLVSARLQDGKQLFFNNGVLKETRDASGNLITYQYEMADGLASLMKVNRNGSELSYDSTGYLTQIKTGTGTLHRIRKDSNQDGQLNDADITSLLLEEAGGNRLSDFELDAGGRIVKGIIETKEGIKQFIRNGVMTGYETLDGKVFSVAGGQARLNEWKMRDGTTVKYLDGRISEIVNPDKSRLHSIVFNPEGEAESYTQAMEDGSVKIFKGNKLSELQMPAGQKIVFGASGQAEKILLEDGKTLNVKFIEGVGGQTESIIFEGSGRRYAFKPDGTITSLLTDGVQALFQNGAVQKIYTGFGEIIAPQFNGEGLLSGEIRYVDGARHFIAGGKLQRMLLASGTDMRYEDGRLRYVYSGNGYYRIDYSLSAGSALSGAQLFYQSSAGSFSQPLVPYLLKHPDSELGRFMLANPLYNALQNRFQVQSDFNAGNSLFLSHLLPDAERGQAYTLFGAMPPYLRNARSSFQGFLADMNGDGLQDYVSPASASSWFVQYNTGGDFADPVEWKGVAAFDGSANAEKFSGARAVTLGTLADIDNDGWIDRVMQKEDGSQGWYVQRGSPGGFGGAVLWADNVQIQSSGEAAASYASRVSTGTIKGAKGDLLAGLVDLDGDGDLDRVVRPSTGSFNHWFFQENLGAQGFADALPWNGIDTSFFGSAAAGSALSHDTEHRNGLSHPIFGTLKRWADSAESDLAGWWPRCEYDCVQNYWQLFAEEAQDLLNFFGWSRYLHPGLQGGGGAYNHRYQQERQLSDEISMLSAEKSLLSDLNGDNKPDRVLIDNLGAWYVQLNNGTGFEQKELWDASVKPVSAVPAEAASAARLVMGYDNDPNVLAGLHDLTGDGKPDRITVDHGLTNNAALNDLVTLLWQFPSFNLADAPQSGSSEGWPEFDHWFNHYGGRYGYRMPPRPYGAEAYRNFMEEYFYGPIQAQLTRAGWDAFAVPSTKAQANQLIWKLLRENSKNQKNTSWWVEVNTGSGFADAVKWTGIAGDTFEQTVIGQGDTGSAGPLGFPGALGKTRYTQLADMNRDNFADRLIYDDSADRWKIQYGTGSGFLPLENLKIEGLSASASNVNSSLYENLHVSLKADRTIPSAEGFVRIRLGNPGDPQSFQEWTVRSLTSRWQDFYLPINSAKPNAAQISVEFIPSAGVSAAVVQIDNVTFTSLRPNTSKDWLDRFLADEEVLSDIHTRQASTLASFLGVSAGSSEKGPLSRELAERLRNAEVKVDLGMEASSESRVHTFAGQITRVQNGRILETRLPDGRVITYGEPSAAEPNRTTQTVTDSQGTSTLQTLNYGRVRSITRGGGKPALEYSYEFTASGSEITIVRDPETGVIERYGELTCLPATSDCVSLETGKSYLLLSRLQADGMETRYIYAGDGKLAGSHLLYKGSVHKRFEYEKAASGNTVLVTDNGTREEYSASGEILFHTTAEGYRYAHTVGTARKVVTAVETHDVALPDGRVVSFPVPVVSLEDDPQGLPVHSVRLESFRKQDGTAAYFENGILKSLLLPDNNSIQPAAIHYNRVETIESVDAETGNHSVGIKILDVSFLHPDGTVTEFKNGSPDKVISASGLTINLAKQGNQFVDPDESALFHYGQALGLWNTLILPKWNEYKLPGDLAVELEYTKEGELLSRQFAEGTIQLYEKGNITELLASDGERLIQYTYDPDGNPLRIHMEGSRRRLETAVLKLEAEVEMKRQEALAQLAGREQVLNQTIEGQYVVARDKLLEVRSKLEAQMTLMGSMKIKGKAGKRAIGNAFGTINFHLDHVNGALAEAARNRADALARLHEQVGQVSEDIRDQSVGALVKIREENQKIRRSILEEEVSPVIYHWYRKILGRDASKTEYAARLSEINYEAGTLDVNALKTRLQTSAEFNARTLEVNAIRTKTAAQLRHYLTLTGSAKKEFATRLGILESELAALTAAEAEAVITYLNKQSLHFGQSAYIALEAMLADGGLQKMDCHSPGTEGTVCRQTLQDNAGKYSRLNVAVRLILTDILTGTLTPVEEGDLVLSVYAMRRTAQSYGLSLGAWKLNYESLKAMYEDACPGTAACGFRFITHINRNHFVIVTKVTAGEVRYIDPGAGPESSPDVVTLTRDEFLKIWNITPNLSGQEVPAPQDAFGYIITARAPPQNTGKMQAAPLSVREEMSVRGAFFPFIALLIAAIVKAIVAAVAAVVAAIVATVASVISGIGSILSGFGAILTGNFAAGFSSIFSGFGQILGSVFTGIKAGILTGHHLLVQFGVVSFVQSISIGALLKSSLIGIGVGELFEGTGRLLEVMGVSPKIARSITSVGKVILGAALLPGSIGSIAGLGLLSGGASEFLGLHTNLSPVITNIVGLGAAAVSSFSTGFNFNGQVLSGLAGLKAAAPYLLQDLASAGLASLGSALSLDPRITALINMPLRASVGNFAASLGAANQVNSASFLAAIKNGLSAGAKEIGFDFAGKITSPVFGSLKSGDILGTIEKSLGREGLFSSILKVVGDAALSPFNAVRGAVESAMSGFKDFQSLIREKGTAAAFESLATSVFSQRTLENLRSSGGVAGAVSSAVKVLTTLNGQSVHEQNLGGGTSLFYDLAGKFIGKKENGITQTGIFGATALGKWGLLTGHVTALFGSLVFAGEIENGQLANGALSDASGTIGRFTAEGGEYPITIDGREHDSDTKNKSFWNVVFNYLPYALDLYFSQGQLKKANVQVSPSSPGSGTVSTKEIYVLANGIGNLEDSDAKSPDYIRNLQTDMKEQSQITDDDLLAIPLYRPTLPVIEAADNAFNKAVDALKWTLESQFLPTRLSLAGGVREKLKHVLSRPVVAMGYSGGFVPLVEGALFAGTQVKSFISLAGIVSGIAAVGQGVVNLIVQAVDKIQRGVLQGLEDLLNRLFEKIPVAGNVIGFVTSIIGFVQGNVLDRAFSIFKDALKEVGRIYPPALPNALPSSTDVLVNLWGTKDILYDFNLVGARNEVSGFTPGGRLDANQNITKQLFNIEIIGASHFDYMKRGASAASSYMPPGETRAERTWNVTVSQFVTRLILNSTSIDSLARFLRGRNDVLFDTARKVWVVNLPVNP